MKSQLLAKQAASRGAAALEFALTLPLILAFLGGLITFFSVAHARSQLLDIVGNVTRGCGMLAVDHAQVSACAQGLGNLLIAGGGVHENACLGSPISLSRSVTSSGRPPTMPNGPTMWTLSVTASCDNWKFTPLSDFMYGGGTAAPIQFKATAAVAFLSVN
jgi:hypothetical protein